MASLEARLAPLAKDHKGKVALAVKNLETGESYYLHADEVMPTASLIKIAVLIELYQQAQEGKIKLTDRVTLRAPTRCRAAAFSPSISAMEPTFRCATRLG